METKYPNTLVSSREDKKLAYASDIYSKYFDKFIEDKVIDLDNDNYTIKSNTANNTENIESNSTAITNLQVTTQHITDTLSTEYYNKSAVDSKLSAVSQNTWYTSELIDCTDTSHAAYVFHIRINKSVMNIHYITSVTVKLRTQLSNTLGNTSCIINNGDGTRLGVSKNMIHQYNNTGQYVTWYFNPIIIPSTDDTILLEFQWEGQDYAGQLGIHVNGNKSEGVTCQDQDGNNHSNWCPALGFNVTPLVQLDLYNKFVSLNS